MKRILQTCMAVVLCLSLFSGQAAALTASERFRRAAELINERGLIAEQSPIPQETIEEEATYLDENPQALSGILNDILSGMDSHSMYLTADEYQTGFSTLSGYAGVGIAVERTAGDGLVIRQVVRHSPAAEAGIQAGDRLTAIDGVSADELPMSRVAELLQGESGSRVALEIERAGERRTVTLTRETILQGNVSARQAAPGVEYIAVTAFSSMNDAEDFAEIWDGLDEKQTRAVILDLRGNGGGMIDAALAMLDKMLEPRAETATMHYRADQGGDEVCRSPGGGLPLNKTVVLVGGSTASAAELMAGVLHEVGGATLVGTKTYGKSQGQYHIKLDGDYLVLTCLEMRLPKSGSWEGRGLAPDVEAHALRTIRGYLNQAAPLDVTDPVRYGEQSEQARAVCQRLHALGYLMEPTDVLDTPALGALRRFQLDAGMDTRLGADQDTLRALDAACESAASHGRMIDDVYYTALALCREAAGQPLRYRAQADGSWCAA